MQSIVNPTPEELQDFADFDRVFTVTPAGTLEAGPANVYAPDVFHDDVDDIDIMGDGWEPLTGYTGQHGYNGAVMHASEFLGGGLARDILETPGTYVVVAVEVHSESPYPHRWDAECAECAECGASSDEGACPSHPDYPNTEGMSYGEILEIDAELTEEEPAGWAVLRYTGDDEDA